MENEKTLPNSSTTAGLSSPLPKLGCNLSEISLMTGFSERTIRRFVQRGLLHPVKASRRLIFSLKEIERFLAATTSS